MKNKVTIRQASMLVFLAVISMKFLLMPATMSKYAGKDIYFAVFLGLAVDFVTLIIYLQTAKKYPNKTFYEIMSSHFGTIFTKIIYFLLAVIFFFNDSSFYDISNFEVVVIVFEQFCKFAVLICFFH